MLKTDRIPATQTDKGATCGLPRRFEFARDSFAFANELVWEYRFDAATGKTTFSQRVPPPNYAHRCFVLARSARQFLYHVQFDPTETPASDERYRQLIRAVVSRNPRQPCAPDKRVVFSGFASLREFSAARAGLLKSECGGAWRSYVLRSHWRMVFPISRAHQTRTAAALTTALQQGGSPIIHLVRFPKLSINHGMVLFDVSPTATGFRFAAYDPNDPAKPTSLSYETATRTFFLPANHYWAGGHVDVIEIYCGWFM